MFELLYPQSHTRCQHKLLELEILAQAYDTCGTFLALDVIMHV